MKQTWFKKAGWFYLPVHAMGILVTLAAIVFMVPVGMGIFRNGHSVSGPFYETFINATCTAFWWKWIAEKTSE